MNNGILRVSEQQEPEGRALVPGGGCPGPRAGLPGREALHSGVKAIPLLPQHPSLLHPSPQPPQLRLTLAAVLLAIVRTHPAGFMLAAASPHRRAASLPRGAERPRMTERGQRVERGGEGGGGVCGIPGSFHGDMSKAALQLPPLPLGWSTPSFTLSKNN